MSSSLIPENVLSITVLEWLVILVVCKIKGINQFDASESENSGRITIIVIQKIKLKIYWQEIFSNSFFK